METTRQPIKLVRAWSISYDPKTLSTEIMRRQSSPNVTCKCHIRMNQSCDKGGPAKQEQALSQSSHYVLSSRRSVVTVVSTSRPITVTRYFHWTRRIRIAMENETDCLPQRKISPPRSDNQTLSMSVFEQQLWIRNSCLGLLQFLYSSLVSENIGSLLRFPLVVHHNINSSISQKLTKSIDAILQESRSTRNIREQLESRSHNPSGLRTESTRPSTYYRLLSIHSLS